MKTLKELKEYFWDNTNPEIQGYYNGYKDGYWINIQWYS